MNRILIAIIFVIIILAAFIYFINSYISSKNQPIPAVQSAQTSEEAARSFTLEELKKYNGTDSSLPIYLALDGLVYDVTAGREFYAPGGPYNSLAGRDASMELKIVGGDIIKRKYPVVGRLSS